MTRGDMLVIACVALLALLAWPASRIAAGSGGDTVVITGPDGVTTSPLDADSDLQIAGVHGTVEVSIAGGLVRVTGSSCPGRLCVRQGAISRSGDAIVCVPNGVTVRIGGGGHALDSVVR